MLLLLMPAALCPYIVYTSHMSRSKDTVHLAPTHGKGSEDNGHDLCKRCDRLPRCGRHAGSLPAMSNSLLRFPACQAWLGPGPSLRLG